ncbi:MAG: sigma-70 family RNA polymerase sigma factor, partial [Bacteroidaceae bacterium]|nr:sigma-70 family RNA polymerase sigma factor [Bacteroidaceae bacterium]
MKRLTANALSALTDAELMQRIGRGEHAAFDTIYNRYAQKLGGFFLRMLAYDTAKAEDMVQELFTRMWTHRREYRSEQPFATWLYAMAYNLCKNEYRHETVRQAYVEEIRQGEEATHEPTEAMERDELRQRMRQAVQLLPTAQMQVTRWFETILPKTAEQPFRWSMAGWRPT